MTQNMFRQGGPNSMLKLRPSMGHGYRILNSRGGQGLSSLVRKDGVTEASLNQISFGRRSAFALSIFLAQNAQLRSAPPVMLIDDLNALSFLDFLREVALSGNRQILIPTASEKLAMLFQRKFDFLAVGFRRHDLHR